MVTFGWLARNEAEVPEGTAWLSEWEAQRLARMRYTKRRREYLTSRFTAKQAMALLLGEPPEPLGDFEVRHHVGGAPAPHVRDEPAPLAVSMTDRADWAVTVASPDRERRLGVDLELVERRSDAFIRDWFTPAERDVAMAATGEDRAVLANLFWSAKESGLKVLQTGLRRDTRSVEVQLDDDAAGQPAARAQQPGHASDESLHGVQWQRLTVVVDGRTPLPGWWCRLGQFVLSVAADVELPPPVPLAPTSLRLAEAEPRHTWVTQPLTEP